MDFEKLADNMQINIYLTDIETYEIIFMNKKMKETYNLQNPEGQICWKVLQKNQNGPCSFCPVKKLKKHNDLYKLITWRENSELTESVFENHDSLIQLKNGKIVHMQQSIDITNSEILSQRASIDDLSGVLNRRAGKEKLYNFMCEKKAKNENFTIALLDINNLKSVNDAFGHFEGDFLIEKVALSIKSMLSKDEFIFRLGGDEFVVVFDCKTPKEVKRLLINSQKFNQEMQNLYEKPYELSYSFGIYNVLSTNRLTINDIIAKADEQMYQEKLRYRRTQLEEIKDELVASAESAKFDYDSTQLYEALIKSTDDFIYICNMKTGVFRYSPAQVKAFNLPGEIIDHPLPFWKKIVHPQDWERFYKSNMEIGENKMDYHSVEFRALNCDDEYIWLKCRGQLMRDEFGEPTLFAGIMTQLDRQNKIDPLTHLYNRQEFAKAIKAKTKDSAIDNLGVMIVDIDDFKNINEIYDRSFGDFILKMVAQLVQSLLPGNTSIYKLDNDQIGLLIENTKEYEITSLYEEIQKRLLNEQLLKRYKCPIQISAGCAMYPKDGVTYNELNKYADYSLQYAKDNGKNRLSFFSSYILGHKMRSLEILKYIRESVSDNYKGFELHYQPQVDATTKKIKGVEALLRWQCPELGKVSPVEFIPILEENGLIIPVGLWVIKEAITACSKWIVHDPEFLISINVSALQLLNSDFVSDIKKIFKDSVVAPENIVLELTESYMVRNMDLLRAIFDQLRVLGFKIAMDDFGTGYASLEVLKTVPADIVKIDQTFVREIHTNKFDKTFIHFIAQICHDVDIKVILEGIETIEEFEVVEPMGLDYIQGFLFGRPQGEDLILTQLKEQK